MHQLSVFDGRLHLRGEASSWQILPRNRVGGFQVQRMRYADKLAFSQGMMSTSSGATRVAAVAIPLLGLVGIVGIVGAVGVGFGVGIDTAVASE